ncbi:MAG TPA: glycosyltransferase, partial [Candidatus Acidoferrum sp.]|nr:glycosyltransferase [Candidatus Acidoferrum sp.]
MEFVFWLCLSLILYVYLGYPLLLLSGFLGRRRIVPRRGILPSLSILVPAHNEERMIRAKLQNLLSQDYPPDKLEILVGDDGSTDATAGIVGDFQH